MTAVVKEKEMEIESGPPEFDLEKRVYTVNEIMEILNLSRAGTYNLIDRGVFHSVRAAGCIRISKKSFDEWLEAQKHESVKDVGEEIDKLHELLSAR